MNKAEIRRTLSNIKARCKIAEIKFEDESDVAQEHIDLTIHLPCGRETRPVFIFDEEDLAAFNNIPFENYTLLADIASVIEYSTGTLEAILTSPGMAKNSFRRRQVLKQLDIIEADGTLSEIKLDANNDASPLIKIGPSTEAAKLLNQIPDPLGISLFIRSPAIKSYDASKEILERTSNSVFFDIDIERGAHVSLLRRAPRRRRSNIPAHAENLRYPKNEYDKAPMALYWYARGADGMPLLQFLAFYQAIEYHYSIYFNVEIGKKIRTIIKQPTFRVERDLDISKITNILRSHGHGGISERDQLKATIRECVSLQDVEGFLLQDKDRATFFGTKAKGIASHLINPQNKQSDLTMQVAERICEVRCKIVHLKGEHEEGELEFLLPNSPEAIRLSYDIDLVQFIAQKVIIAASKRWEDL